MHFSIFAMVDSENHCVPVTIYNMALGSGFAVGDSVAIPEPFCQETDFTENEQVFARLICIIKYCNTSSFYDLRSDLAGCLHRKINVHAVGITLG